MKFVFIADAFANMIHGGGELNNQELIGLLKSQGHEVEEKLSHHVTITYLKSKKDWKFIISNFWNLNSAVIRELAEQPLKIDYCIYEHDHKYLESRNPAEYPNFKVPKSKIVNYKFYESAAAVICQSEFHADIVRLNLGLDNIISVGGNLWSEEILEKLKSYSLEEKEDRCSIMHSPIPHKNTAAAIRYCKAKELPFGLVANSSYENFLHELTRNKTLVFFPQTPETLSRIVVEARMAGMKVVTNNLVGAAQESWFSLKGPDLVDIMMAKRQEIPKLIMEIFVK